MKAKAQTNYKSEADRIAAERGGRCLSSEIPTTRFRALWKCASLGHPHWRAKFESVKGWSGTPGTWCRRCYAERKAEMLRYSTDYVRSLLEKQGIELQSEYNGINEPILCRCKRCAHLWTTTYRLRKRHRCPGCERSKIAERRRTPRDQIVAKLRSFSITVRAIHYEKPTTRVSFLCDVCGFEGNKGLWNDLRRRGCPECGRRRSANAQKLTFDYVEKYFADKGATLLSREYKNSKTKLHVLFECGCEGAITFNSFQNGERCGNCRPNARVTIADYHQLAALHGGSLVAAAATTNQPAKWKCRKPHLFSRPYSNIQQSGTFCPDCSKGLSERICKAAAEQLFGVSFKKIPLPGVRGIGGRNLVFDAYSEPLKLAIEHNGPQHYRPVRFGNQTEFVAVNCFIKQQEHDRRRREFCRASGITLIEVPELGKWIKTEDLKEFIRSECQRANFKLPDGFNRVHLRLDAHHLATTAEEMWERVLKRVREIDYTLKTANYPGANGRLSLLCRNSHEYKPRVANFLDGYTCRRCLIQQRAVTVVVLASGAKAKNRGYASACVFDTIEDCAKAIGTSSNNVRIVAKGRGNSCMGFGVVQITQAQAKCFRESRESLVNFCRMKWPSPETYDRQDGSRKRLSKAVVLSDGRRFPSKAAAARALGVTMAAVAFAVRKGSQCQKLRISLAALSV